MVDWTKEAVTAALDMFSPEYRRIGEIADMRAALDAAVKAQGNRPADFAIVSAYESGYEAGRAEALEGQAEGRGRVMEWRTIEPLRAARKAILMLSPNPDGVLGMQALAAVKSIDATLAELEKDNG